MVAGNERPGAPIPTRPADAADVPVGTTVTLEVQSAIDPEGDELTYVFEIYDDEALTRPVEVVDDIAEGQAGFVRHNVRARLAPATYYWRARAVDAEGAGEPSDALQFTVYRIPPPEEVDSSGGCSVGNRSGWSLSAALIMLGLALARRRREGER